MLDFSPILVYNESMKNKEILVIYAYTYPEHIERPKVKGKIVVKIGDTTQGLDEGLTIDESGKVRIDQQGNAAEAYKKVIIGTWGVDKSVINRDFVLHNKLQLEGRRPAYLDGKGQEWFELDGSVENVKSQIDNLIKSFGISSNQKLKLREEQKRVLEETNKIIKETDSDKVSIVWSLPPRFGKTTSALKQFADSGKRVMILPSAWLSSHTSFRDDSEAFADFDDMIYIETANNPNYKQTIDEALKSNKKVIVSVSLFATDKRYFKPLKEIYNDDKFVVVDEGDHAAWTSKKRKILNYILDGKKHGKMILISMSGTNIARMVTGSDKLDGYVQSTYMALEQTQKDIVKRSYVKLQLDKTDKYVADLTEEDYFSYNKVIANPNKSSNFIIERTKALVGLSENKSYKNLNLNTILGEDANCIMEFVNGTKEQMDAYANIIRNKVLKNWRVEVLNSDYTSNKKAQDQIKTAIAEAKNQKLDGVWIISNTMGSRSFSISEIQATLISYDGGGMDPTIQKMSRSLTPGKLWNGKTKQTGYIITMSIDSNRDQIATDILTTEAAVQSQITGQPLPKVIKTLLNNVSILSTDEYGNILELKHTDLQAEMSKTETLKKVAFAMCRPDNILKDEILLDEFMKMKFGKKKNKKETALLPKAKNFISTKQNKLSLKQKKSIMSDVVKRIKLLCDSSSMVAVESDGKTFKECLNNFDKDRFKQLFGIESKNIIRLLDKNVLPEKLLDIIVSNTNNIIETGDINTFHDLDTIGVYPQLGIVKSDEKNLWLDKFKKIKDIKNKNIVSVGTNMGFEVAALLELGVPKDNITIIDKDGFSKLWKNAGIEYINKPLEEINDMKFDLCVGNPPFSEGNTGKGGTSIYQNFAEWALKNSDKVMMITPGSFMTGSKFESMRNELDKKGISNIEKIPLDTFSGASIVDPVFWVADGGLKKVKDFLSNDIKLFNKIVNNHFESNYESDDKELKVFDIKGGKGNVSTSDTENLSESKTSFHTFKYIDRVLKDGPVIVYCTESLKTNPGKYLTVFAQRGGMNPKMFLSKNVDGYSQNVIAISVKNEEQHNNLVKLFTTSTYKFMLNVLCGGNTRTRKGMPGAFTSGKIRSLPALDLDVSWTNTKVNEALKLSDEDIKFINEYVA